SPIQGEVYGGDRHDVLVFIAGLAPVAPSSDRWRVYGTTDVAPPPDHTYPGEAMWEAFSLPEQSFAVPLDAVAGLLDVVRQLSGLARLRPPTAQAWWAAMI